MNTKNITSIGEILFDVYNNEKQIGGAPFNFIYHVNKIIGDTNFITSVGKDKDGEQILKFLDEHNISKKYVDINNEKSTGKVLIELNDDKIPEFNIRENSAYDFISLSNSEEQEIVYESKLIYFGTLCQRNNVSRKTIQSLISSNVLSMLDINIRQNYYTKEIIEKSLSACGILKINEDELNLICELCIGSNQGYLQNVAALKSKYDINIISVTKGKEGAEIFSKSESNFCSSPNVEAVDTVGAGDAYSAILAIGILKGLSIEKTNRLAVSFAAEVIQRKGALIYDDKIYDKYRESILNE
jgi:fructokinase